VAWTSLNSLWKIISLAVSNPNDSSEEIAKKLGADLTGSEIADLLKEHYKNVWEKKKESGAVSGDPPKINSIRRGGGKPLKWSDEALNKILDSGKKDPNRGLSDERYDELKSLPRYEKSIKIRRWYDADGNYVPYKSGQFEKKYTLEDIKTEFQGANQDIYDEYKNEKITEKQLRQRAGDRRHWRLKAGYSPEDFIPERDDPRSLEEKKDFIKEMLPNYPFDDRSESQINSKYYYLKDYGAKLMPEGLKHILSDPVKLEKASINLGTQNFYRGLERAGPQAYPLYGNKDAQRFTLNEYIDSSRTFLTQLSKGEIDYTDQRQMGHIDPHKRGGLFYNPNLFRQDKFENLSGGAAIRDETDQPLLSREDIKIDNDLADNLLDIMHKHSLADDSTRRSDYFAMTGSGQRDRPSGFNIFNQLEDKYYIPWSDEQSANVDKIIQSSNYSGDVPVLLPQSEDPRWLKGLPTVTESDMSDKKKRLSDLRTRVAGHSPSSASVRGLFGTKLR